MMQVIEVLKYLKHLPKRMLLLLRGYNIGRNVVTGSGVTIEKRGTVIGHHVYIGQYSYIGGNTLLGNYCMLSDNVNIVGHDHNFNRAGVPIISAGRPDIQPVTIVEDDVWIGHGATIMRGLRVGEGSIIGANSVVTKDVPPYSIFVGVPARFVRFRFSEQDQVIHRAALEKLRVAGR